MLMQKVILKFFAPFKKCITEISTTQVDNAKDVIPSYNLLEYSHNYLKTLRSLYPHCRDEPALDNTVAIVDFTNDNTADSFLKKK